MGLLDRLLGRTKQAAGDIADKPEMRQEGVHQEQQAEAEERAEAFEERAQTERESAAEHRAERTD
jgi:uncharacterized protein YjbJ (UPF0337 family)